MSLSALNVKTSDLLLEIKSDMSMAFENAISRNVPDWHTTITSIVASAGKSTKYPMMGMLTGLREWSGERVFEQFSSYAYALENKTYEKSVGINVDDLEDLQIDHYPSIAAAIAEQVRNWPKKLIFSSLINGGSQLCWDGQFFFDTDHPVDLYDASLGTYSNNFTSRPLTDANLQLTVAGMATIAFKDGEVSSFGESGNLVLVVPPQLEDTARKIVNAELTANGGTNTMKGIADILKINRIGNVAAGGSATTWYLADVGQAMKPLLFQQRLAPTLTSMMGATDPNVFYKNQYEWGVKARGAAGYGMPFLMARCLA